MAQSNETSETRERILQGRLDALTEMLGSIDEPKDQAATALLIAQAHRELEQVLESRRNSATSVWKSPLLYGAALAGFAIFAYFVDFLLPLLKGQKELNDISTEILEAEKANLDLTRIALTDQLRSKELELARNRKQYFDEITTFRSENNRLKTTLEELEQQNASDETGKYGDLIAAAQQRDELLQTYRLVVTRLNIRNCKGIAGNWLSRFGVSDEPSISLNGIVVWPDGPQSLPCPGEYPVDANVLLLPLGSDNIVTVNETDTRGRNPVEMGRIENPVQLADEKSCLVTDTNSDEYCLADFRSHDGHYVLTWRVEPTES